MKCWIEFMNRKSPGFRNDFFYFLCNMLRLYFFTVIYFAHIQVFAQHPFFYAIDTEKGLPSNEVYHILQDHDGYIWIGGDPGLYRFNGIHFLEIPQSGKRSSISNLQITGKNTIWCQNFTGQFFRKDSGKNRLSLLFDCSSKTSGIPDYVAINDSTAYFLTDSIVYHFNSNKTSKLFTSKELHFQSQRLASIRRISNHSIVVVSFGGEIAVVRIRDNTIVNYNVPYKSKNRYQLFENNGSPLLLVEHVLSNHRNYSLYYIKEKKAQPLFIDKNFGNATIIHASILEKKIVLGTSKNAIIIDLGSTLSDHSELLPGQKVSCYLKDREGNHLFSTLQNGIIVIPNMSVRKIEGFNSELKDGNFTSIAQTSRGTLIGNYSGEVYHVNPNSLQFHRFLSGDGPHAAVRQIQEHRGKIFIARGSFDIHDGNKTISLDRALNNTRRFCFYGDTLFFITSDRFGKAWEDGNKWSWKIVRNQGGNTIEVFQNKVYIQFKDGLFTYDGVICAELNNKGEKLIGSGLGIYRDNLIYSTHSGFRCFDGKNWFLPEYLESFKNDEISRFVVRNNVFYIATRESFVIFDPSIRKEIRFNQYQGVPAQQITSIFPMKGSVLLGTTDGIVQFPEKPLRARNTVPILSIDSITSRYQNFESKQRIELDYNDGELAFFVNSSSIKSRGNFSFEYRLHGFEKQWNSIPGSQNKILFNSLAAGNYTIEIQVVMEDGSLSKTYIQKIKVNTPLWQKGWFHFTSLFLVLLVAYVVFRHRLKSIKRKEQMKHQMISAKLTALKAQMNPHFLFNTLNSLQDLILQQEFEKTNYYLGKFAGLIRMILSTSEREFISLNDEKKLLQSYLELEQLRFGSDFQFTLQVDPSINGDLCQLPPLLLQPFVENAIKHGLLHKKGEKKLDIVFNLIDSTVVCEIVDNGIGLKKSTEINRRNRKIHHSFSTDATEKRIQLLREQHQIQYEISINNIGSENESNGTCVTLLFPY